MQILMRILLASIWGWLALTKLVFGRVDTSLVPILPQPVLVAVAVIELLVALGCLCKGWRWAIRAGIALCLGMLCVALFAAAAGWDLASCGCAGPKPLTWGAHMSLILGLMGLSIALEFDWYPRLPLRGSAPA